MKINKSKTNMDNVIRNKISKACIKHVYRKRRSGSMSQDRQIILALFALLIKSGVIKKK